MFGKLLYLSPILDLFIGEVDNYGLTGSPSFAATIEMLKKTFQRLTEKVDLISHSDQGWHYQMKQYQDLLPERGVQQSMPRNGNCYDNAVIENFFGLLQKRQH